MSRLTSFLANNTALTPANCFLRNMGMLSAATAVHTGPADPGLSGPRGLGAPRCTKCDHLLWVDPCKDILE